MILEEFDYDKDAILNPAHFMESQIIANGLVKFEEKDMFAQLALELAVRIL